MWEEKFDKVLLMPELAMIRFEVFDEDVGLAGLADDFIAQFSIPFTSLRPGSSFCLKFLKMKIFFFFLTFLSQINDKKDFY